jgi:MFS family permease
MALDGKNLGLVSLAFLGADTVTNLGWGLAGDRFGFRSTFIVSVVCWMAATALLMAAPAMGAHHLGLDVRALILMAFFGLGAAQSGFLMSSQTMVLEFGARDDIAMRLALTSTAQGAMSAIGPLAGGLIAATLGYEALFGVSIGFLTAALIILLTRVDEPRFRGVA